LVGASRPVAFTAVIVQRALELIDGHVALLPNRGLDLARLDERDLDPGGRLPELSRCASASASRACLDAE
jgi:hypothetical protein